MVRFNENFTFSFRAISALVLVLLLLPVGLFSQEALKSAEEDYYDFLSLQGLANRPALNYRTLSDGQWRLEGEAAEGSHVWAGNNLGTTFTLWQDASPAENWFARGLLQGIDLKVYGPEWYNSYNTAAPYGQNDGALWQGKGYNTSLTAGIRFESYGFELTLKPQLSFSQNLSFDLMPSNTDSPYGYFWGYGKNVGVDAPQRFGDKPFFVYDWGDSEVRWTWHSFTVGFGTQAIWLGPASINPILHSNNAPSYPKVDIGLRRQPVVLPWLGWYLGDVEARIWTGRLTESDYFDNDDSNNHNMIHGLALAYAPSFVPGLTLFANRTCLVKWDWANMKYIWPLAENTHVGEQGAGEDQKMSFGFDWVFPQVGFEVYGEVGVDDFFQGGFLKGFARYPFDSMMIIAGLKKVFNFGTSLKGEFVLEYANFELPRNRQRAKYAFNFHHQVVHGYTNRGQAVGSPLGVGGNSQTLVFNLYYPKGMTGLTISRNNPDDTYMYWKVGNENQWYKANFIISVDSLFYITRSFSVFGGLGFDWIINPYYDTNKDITDIYNFTFNLGAKYSL